MLANQLDEGVLFQVVDAESVEVKELIHLVVFRLFRCDCAYAGEVWSY